MRGLAKIISRLFVWVLALLAPLQPILALDCSCVCQGDSEGRDHGICADADCEPAGHTACEHCHTKRTTHATAEDRDTNETHGNVGHQWLPGCRSCDCPQDCKCHLRHATRIGILSAPASRVSKDLSGVPLGQMQLPMPVGVIAQSNASLPQNFSREMPALAVCALLCRFSS